jgi:hypothetical protein
MEAIMNFAVVLSTLLAMALLENPASAQAIGTTTARTIQHKARMNRFPEFDYKPGCRAILSEEVESSGSCEADEQSAREQLFKEWSQFSGPDQSMCTDLTLGYDPSYVELLSCLEIMRDSKSGSMN